MIDISSLIDHMEQGSPILLQSLALCATTETFDYPLFNSLLRESGIQTGGIHVEELYEDVIDSRLVERTLDGHWQIRFNYRFSLTKYLKDTGNGAYAAVHQFLAQKLERDELSPKPQTVKERQTFTRWLYHSTCASNNGHERLIKAFENVYQKNWVGDSRAIVGIIFNARKEQAGQDPEFIAMSGLQAYREGRIDSAISHFNKLWSYTDRPKTLLIAIALHLFGRLRDNLSSLDESEKILRDIDRHGLAQVLHTRGKLCGERGWRQKEAVLKDLDESEKIERDINRLIGLAQVLHTRGKLCGERGWRQKEAVLKDLDESEKIGREIHNQLHLAQVLHTRGKLCGERGWRQKEAVLKDLDESEKILRDIDLHGLAQVLHTRGKLCGERGWRQKEAILKDLDESEKILRDIDLHGLAQVLRTKTGLKLRDLQHSMSTEKIISDDVAKKIIDDLVLSFHLDQSPKSRSTAMNFLARYFQLIGDEAMEGAAIRLKHEFDMTPGGGGQAQKQRTVGRLTVLEDQVSSANLNEAINRLRADIKERGKKLGEMGTFDKANPSDSPTKT